MPSLKTELSETLVLRVEQFGTGVPKGTPWEKNYFPGDWVGWVTSKKPDGGWEEIPEAWKTAEFTEPTEAGLQEIYDHVVMAMRCQGIADIRPYDQLKWTEY